MFKKGAWGGVCSIDDGIGAVIGLITGFLVGVPCCSGGGALRRVGRGILNNLALPFGGVTDASSFRRHKWLIPTSTSQYLKYLMNEQAQGHSSEDLEKVNNTDPNARKVGVSALRALNPSITIIHFQINFHPSLSIEYTTTPSLQQSQRWSAA